MFHGDISVQYKGNFISVQYKGNFVVRTFLRGAKGLIGQQQHKVSLHHGWGSGRHCMLPRRSSSTIPKRFWIAAILNPPE